MIVFWSLVTSFVTIHQISGNIIFTGGYDVEIGASPDIYDDILEYEPEEDAILSVGHMLRPRCWHAVSVVQVQDYAPCPVLESY